MTIGSCFSGIGGELVAATMMGWEVKFHCEINPFGRKVLQYWYPNAESYEDITKTDFSEWEGKINVLTGGFPCQPFSYAGKRGGAKDDRYLWPYMHKCIQQVKPDWVVCENVSGIASMVEQGNVLEMAGEADLFAEGYGLRRYQLRETFTLERISNDLESDGYSVQAVVIPACAVSAPHRRDRVFIVGCRNGKQLAENTLRMGCKGGDAEQGSKRNIGNTCAGGGERICGEISRIDSADTMLRGSISPRTSEASEGNGIEELSQSDEQGAGHAPCWDSRLFGFLRHTTDTCQSGLERDFNKGEQTSERFALGMRLNTSRYDRQAISNPNGNREREGNEYMESELADGAKTVGNGRERNVADTERERLLSSEHIGQSRLGERLSSWCGCRTLREGAVRSEVAGCGRWANFPTVSPVHRGNDGLPFPVDDLTIPFSKWRTESLKAYGNAIVVQVMYEIFRAIEIVESQTK